jgi:hypothetical protein
VEAADRVHEPGPQAVGQQRGERPDVHPVGVDRHGVQQRTRGLEDLQGADVDRILDDHGVAGVERRARHQVERLLGATGGDHVAAVKGAAQALRLVRGDDVAQPAQAGRLAVLHDRRVGERRRRGRCDPLVRQQIGARQAARPAAARPPRGQGGSDDNHGRFRRPPPAVAGWAR